MRGKCGKWEQMVQEIVRKNGGDWDIQCGGWGREWG